VEHEQPITGIPCEVPVPKKTNPSPVVVKNEDETEDDDETDMALRFVAKDTGESPNNSDFYLISSGYGSRLAWAGP
jgi:hypothetical protein